MGPGSSRFELPTVGTVDVGGGTFLGPFAAEGFGFGVVTPEVAAVPAMLGRGTVVVCFSLTRPSDGEGFRVSNASGEGSMEPEWEMLRSA